MDLLKRTSSPATWIAVAALCLLLGACSDDGTTSANEAGIPAGDGNKPTDGSANEGGGSDGSGGSVTIHGTLRVYGASKPTTIPGVEVSIDGNAAVTCATSDTAGCYKLDDVPDVDSLIKHAHASYYPQYVSYGQGQPTRTYDTWLLTPAQMSTMLGQLEPGKGVILLTSTSGTDGAEGTSFSVSPAAGEGPYYLDVLGVLDKSLTATTKAGHAFVVNVDPGVYRVIYNSNRSSCTRHQAWEVTPGSKLKVKVVADSATVATVLCQ
jgi:hypothetical protein